MKVFITGRPRIGKTTALLRIYEGLKSKGVNVGGMITLELREGGVRKGFKIIDLSGEREGILALKGSGKGPSLGSYSVHVDELEEIGVGAIRRALRDCEVVIIDEIGPMELFSKSFKSIIIKAILGPKPMIASVHRRIINATWFRSLQERVQAKMITLTLTNRCSVPTVVVEEVMRCLRTR